MSRALLINLSEGEVIAKCLAEKVGISTDVAGIVQDAEYFRNSVEPFLDGQQIRYVGSVGPTARDELLGRARALLHLIGFDEPFGLSVIEAMASGTPVVAYARGSMPELIEHGISGFLVEPDNIESAVFALSHLGELDRRDARAHVEKHFSAERMIDDYLCLYHRILDEKLPEQPTAGRRARPGGGRCDACHTRRSHVQRSRDGLLTVCRQCARGAAVINSDAGEAIETVVSRAPVAERRALTRRLLARQTMHQTRRERRRAGG